ncbi:MAG: M3 family metallopeptidase [Thermoplasmata archaeon]
MPFDLPASELRDRAQSLLSRAEREIADLLAPQPPPSVVTFLEPLNRILTGARSVSTHGELIFCVHPDEATRAAGRDALEAADRWYNTLLVHPGVYAALQALDLRTEDDATRFAVSKMLRSMRRAGADREPSVRDRLLALSNEIDRTSNQFSENIAKSVRGVEVDAATGLRGLPADYVAAHPRDARGKVRITTRYPDFFPVVAYADDADLRRRLVSEFLNVAFPENLPILDRLLAHRWEFARTLGYPSHAAYALEDKMMATTGAARAFLERLERLLRYPAEQQFRRFLERKRREVPGADRLELWDGGYFLVGGYYDGKIRTEEFGVDTKVLRAYLPYVRVRDGLFALCSELFGLSFRRVPSADVWHPSVEAYDVTQGTIPVGRCYLDLVPRAGKYSHAACFGIRSGVAEIQLPQSALVCNFLDPGTPPETARMEYGDVVTFFHEFGHLLHALLSGHTRWLFNGQQFVEWDFVEAPSQLFEEWARDPDTLVRFAVNPDTGERIPGEILRRLRGAAALDRASRYLRQIALASTALELYDRDPAGMDSSNVYREAFERYYPRPLSEEYHPQAAFGHLTGYTAAYYTYSWSAVIARDLLSPFFERGSLTDREVAGRYAKEILTAGSVRPAAELIRAYLGREFSFDAFERWVGEPAVGDLGAVPRSP